MNLRRRDADDPPSSGAGAQVALGPGCATLIVAVLLVLAVLIGVFA